MGRIQPDLAGRRRSVFACSARILGMNPDLELALELADAADAITVRHFRSGDLQVETKADLTPVTEADRAVEKAVAQGVAAARPGHSVVGEEFGAGGAEGARARWIIDPIDGTKNYVRGIPVFATLLALEVDGEVVVGVASAPALGTRWWAARGEGAFADGDRIRVSATSAVGDALLSHSSIEGWEKAGRLSPFLQLVHAVGRTRGFGDFWQHVLVAQGSVDVAVEPEVSLWDLAALLVIVEEAGGRFTDLRGTRTAAGGDVISSNGHLHDEVLARINAGASSG
jgi:histidinol-phosphatase